MKVDSLGYWLMQAEPGLASTPLGNAMLQPGDWSGVKAFVLGVATISFPDGAMVPSESGTELVQLMVVVSRLLSGLTATIKNLADDGIVKHACGAVMAPRSSDQYPPGVRG